MLLSRVKYLFTSIKFLSQSKLQVGKLFFFIKTYIHVIGKSFCHEKKTLKKEKKLREISKDNHFWQNEKPIFIWIRDIKKFLLALKWIFVTNKKKTGLTFCFIATWKEVRVNSTEARCRASVEWSLTVRDSVTSSD